MTEWVARLAELAAADRPAVLVTVLSTEGSTPREAGTKMIVTPDAIHGTIGGGHLEFAAIDMARFLMAGCKESGGASARPVLRDFALGPELEQCCGGYTTLLFEPVMPPPWHIALFGAGHVGKEVVRLLGGLACRVTWIDSRAELLAGAHPANLRPLVSERPEDSIAELPEGAHILVMTHSHALDLRIVEQALRCDRFGFLGLIGSETKRARFTSRLAKRGVAAASLTRLTCPIGIAGIGSKDPREIALAITAQLLQIRDSARASATDPRRSEAHAP
jgi:xanthine dehydrogenase accessory factor